MEIVITLGALHGLWIGFGIALFVAVAALVSFFFNALGGVEGGALLSLIIAVIAALTTIGFLIALICWYIANGIWWFIFLPVAVFAFPILIWLWLTRRNRRR